MRIVPFILAFVFNVAVIVPCLFYFHHRGDGSLYLMLAAMGQEGGYVMLVTTMCLMAWCIAKDKSKAQDQKEKSNTQ